LAVAKAAYFIILVEKIGPF